MKTRKMMDIMYKGKHFICIRDFTEDTGTYKLYETWYNCGKHTKLLARYDDPEDVLVYIQRGC